MGGVERLKIGCMHVAKKYSSVVSYTSTHKVVSTPLHDVRPTHSLATTDKCNLKPASDRRHDSSRSTREGPAYACYTAAGEKNRGVDVSVYLPINSGSCCRRPCIVDSPIVGWPWRGGCLTLSLQVTHPSLCQSISCHLVLRMSSAVFVSTATTVVLTAAVFRFALEGCGSRSCMGVFCPHATHTQQQHTSLWCMMKRLNGL